MKNFLKLVKKSVCYVGTVLAFVLVINVWYQYAYRGESITNKYKAMPSEIEVCCFGSSHAQYGIDFEAYSTKTCFNFAAPAQPLTYDYRIFQTYNTNIGNGGIAFIVISYFSFYGRPQTELDDFESKNRLYYHILPDNMVKNYDRKTDIYETVLPVLIAYEGLPKVLFGFDHSDTNFYTKWENVVDRAEVKNTVVQQAEKDVIKDKISLETGERILNAEEIESCRLLIEGLKDKGITPILVTTPFLKEYNDAVAKIDPHFFARFHSDVTGFANDCQTAYLDYSQDSYFTESYDWFVDATHLNRAGAREFTRKLMMHTKELCIEKTK